MTDQSAPKPIATRAAEAAANGWTALVAYAPTVQTLVSSLAIPLLCVVLGIGGTVGYQKATAPLTLPVALPDLPRSAPVPVVSMENLDHALALHCGAAQQKLDVLLQRTEPKGSLKKTSGKR